MEIPLNPDWSIQSKDAMGRLMEMGVEDMGKKNKQFGSGAKAAQVNTATLLLMFKYRSDSLITDMSGFNPSFFLLAENIRFRLGIQTGTDYLDQAKKVLKETQLGSRVTPEYSVKKIDERKFDVMRVNTRNVTQLYCCTVEKGFALVLILSFANDNQEEELMSMLRNTRLK